RGGAGDGATVHALLARSTSLQTISVYDDAQLMLVTSGAAEVLRGLRVTTDFFDTLGVRMAIGRGFEDADAGPGPAGAVILSHELWVNRFGTGAGIVGHLVRRELGGALAVRVECDT